MVFKTVIFFIFFNSLIYSQVKITGKIEGENNLPLQGASVIVTKIKENVILAYAISDINGNYTLRINSKSDSLQVTTSYIGYSKQLKTVWNKNQILNFELYESSEKLKEVVLKNIPITNEGDTINYSVSAFKNQKDRVIGDVLSKMPGIEVLTDGRILYQGKPIQKYFIEGLDLLEGRYNLANNNLPANSVSKIQILENHQPIKLLDSLVTSDRASLNIKLKNHIVVTGTSSLSTGITPFLWDVNITPMFFSKKKQMLTSYQTNNTGNDIINEIKTLTIDDLLEGFDNNNEQNWVTIQKLSPPPFSKNRWLNNNAHLLTTNYLIRLKEKLDLKVNFSYINDVQKQNGNSQTTFITPTDSINIIENTKNRLFFNSIAGKFILTKNSNKNYFKNNLEVKTHWNSENGKIILNDENINQKAEIPFTFFSNKLKLIKPFGKKLVTIKSILSNSKTFQNLRVLPSQFETLLNSGNPLEGLNQKIEHSNFYTNNSFSFIKGFKNFTFIPKIGFTIQNQQLGGNISTFENNIENILVSEFQNNLIFDKTSFYSIINAQYQNHNLKIKLELPLKFQKIKRVDNDLNKTQKLNDFIIEPTLSIKKDLNTFWNTTFLASLKNNFGDINQLYYGYILNNYRNIQKYETPILESSIKNITLGLSYRNPIKSLFINGYYSYSNSNQNLLLGNTINSNGTTSFGFFRKDNNSNTHNINLRGSKYFNRYKSTLTITANASLNNEKQFLNGIITGVTIKDLNLKGKLNTKITEWMNLEYKNITSISSTFLKNQPSFDKIITQEHLLNFSFYPSSIQYIGFDIEHYTNNFLPQNKKNTFLNFNYIYTLRNSKIDLELNWNNILNTKKFTTISNNTFSYTQSTYKLRPRQILMNIKFNF